MFPSFLIRRRAFLLQHIHARSIAALAARPPTLRTLDSSNIPAAKTWIASFRSSRVERTDVELTFVRSSGPGGQNVNKVNTKCLLRCPLTAPWIPLWAKDELRSSTAYVKRDDSLLVTSTQHRSQAENVDVCLRKLHEIVLEAAGRLIVEDPSPEQQKRVKALQRVHKARMKAEKQFRSTVKQSRKGGFDG